MSEALKKKDRELSQIDPEIQQDKKNIDFTKGSVSDFKFYPDKPTSEFNKRNFANKEPSKFYDPCQQSSNMSIKCLEQNNFDKEMCHEYFAAYRECKKEWMNQRKKDRRSGNGW